MNRLTIFILYFILSGSSAFAELSTDQVTTVKSIEYSVNDDTARKFIDCIIHDTAYADMMILEHKAEQCVEDTINQNTDFKPDTDDYINYEKILYDLIEDSEQISALINEIQDRQDPSISHPIYNTKDKYKAIETRLVGEYTLSDGGQSPSGSPSLILLPDKKYAVIGFGSVEGGDWRVVDGKYVHLIPHKLPNSFYLYGRQTPSLGTATQVHFKGNDFGHDMLIGFDQNSASQYSASTSDSSNKIPTLAPIFNAGANCFDSPYIGRFPAIYNHVILAKTNGTGDEEETNVDMYTFSNKNQYNDFYAIYQTHIKNWVL